MSSRHARDEEYQYQARSTSLANGVGSIPPRAMLPDFPSGPSQVSGIGDHVATLLSQARTAGLLPTDAETIPTLPPSSSAPRTIMDITPKRRDRSHEYKRENGRRGNTNPNNQKRRKLNGNNNHNFNKNHNATGHQKAQTKAERRKNLKPPASAYNADPYVQKLIAEALAAPRGPNAPSILTLPKFPTIPKPDDYPPPLPPIHDKALEQQCFTHSSYIHDPSSKENPSSLLHYERLEFLGDSYMNYCVTKILYTRLPDLREGELTRLRSQIISNDNIRHYAMMYRFPDRILLSSGAEKDEVRDTGKKVADIFEAYIGGILTDQPDTGEAIVSKWMKDIIAPQVDEAVKIQDRVTSMNKTAKQELYVLIDAEKGPTPTYVVTRQGDTNRDFEVACLIQGTEFGRGLGKNKNEAGTRAAMQALEKLRGGLLQRKAEREAAEAAGKTKEVDGVDEDEINKENGILNNHLHESYQEAELSEGEIKLETDDTDG
jgi:dsRNA-specific ribonuclease